MKNIILNTSEADETSADKKSYKYYFNKPIVVKDEKTLSLQSITQRGSLATSTTPTSTGLLHLSGLTPFVYNGVPSNYNWTLNAGGYVEEMEVDLTNSAEALVTENDGFTLVTSFTGGKLRLLIYNDTTTTFNSPQTLMVVSEVIEMGSNWETDWYIIIKKRPAGVTYVGNGLNNPLFTITSVRDSLMYQDGYLLYQESVGAFNPIVSQYANEVATIDANFTTPNIDLGQGLKVKFNTTNANPSLIQVDTISSGGYGFNIGDYIYVNKNKFLPSSSGTQFLLPLKLQVISNTPTSTPQPIYDEGLLTIGNTSIDYTTIPTSIYGTFSYVGEWSVDLNDATKCSVFRSNGGASVGTGATLKFFTFKDYATGGFPKTSVLAQITSFGKNYRVGDYAIINETAFPTGYVASGTSVNMRVNITGVSTSEIIEYPKGEITAITLDQNYIGEASSSANYTHSPSTENGQNTDFIWGSGSQYIELKEIVDGGVGFAVNDVFWVNKGDALPTSSTYLTPFKVSVSSIQNTATPPPPNPDSNFRITAKNLLYDFGNITTSKVDTNILIYNKQNSLFKNRDEKIHYKICDLPQQVLMGIELFVESLDGLAPNTNDILILHLKIS